MECFLKNLIARSFLKNPIRFRLFLAFIAILSGVVYPFFNYEETAELTDTKMIFMLGFSTATFAFMLILYRILKNYFAKALKLKVKKLILMNAPW